MIKYLFFLIIPLLLISIFLPINTFAQVEKGFNYDRELLAVNEDGSKTYQWTSHPKRLIDYYWNNKPVYADYKITDNANNITYESFGYSLVFDKLTCGINEYKGGYLQLGQLPTRIMSHVFKEVLYSTDSWYDILDSAPCSFSIVDNQITITKNDVSIGKIIYELNPNNYEWTYDYEHKDSTKTNRKHGFTFLCGDQGCSTITIDGNPILPGQTINKTELINSKYIQVGNSSFDLKENIHGYTWTLKISQDNQLIIDFTDAKEITGQNEHIIVDPVFGFVDDTATRDPITNGVASTSCTAAGWQAISFGTIRYEMKADTLSSGDACVIHSSEWDISSIPNGVTIDDVDLRYDVDLVNAPAINCDWTPIQFQPSLYSNTATDAEQLWNDIVNGTEFVDNSSQCTTTGNGKLLDLGTNADTDLQDNLVSDWWAVGFKPDSLTRDADQHQINLSDLQIQVTYTNAPPNAITDLTTSNITFESIDLSWSQPNLDNGTLSGYQINSTIPYGNPLTILINNTNSSGTTSTISNLIFATQYSFRVSAWTEFGNNATGNIANATTLGESFTVGQVSVNQTNPDLIDIRFQRTDVNSTSTRVDVLYSNSYNLTCAIDHRFARTSQNYSNLDVIVFDASTSNSSFIFNDHTNDLVNMYCYNENDTTNDGRYQITWTSFPLLDQFANFRSGVYGTEGRIGVIDFITLAVIIFSMIGLNRINESVGVIFNVIFLGALAYFGIIELPTIIFGALTVVLVFTIASTRKK